MNESEIRVNPLKVEQVQCKLFSPITKAIIVMSPICARIGVRGIRLDENESHAIFSSKPPILHIAYKQHTRAYGWKHTFTYDVH